MQHPSAFAFLEDESDEDKELDGDKIAGYL